MSQPVRDLSERSTSPGLIANVSLSSIIGLSLLFIAFFISDLPAWKWMFDAWMTSPDNSHGILVPAFCAWLLWSRKSMLPANPGEISSLSLILGVAFLALGIATRLAGIYTRTITLEAGSLLPCFAGIVLICGGWTAARWAWPAVLFLAFMIPLPSAIGGRLCDQLQAIATICSTYFLQMIGVPAVSEGNVIWLTEHPLGVAQACSGLRMLTSFFALAVGACFVIDRPLWEKAVIVVSAPVIAVISNVMRISATAVAYEFGDVKIAEMIFHDLAGWLMMPIGLALLGVELYALSKLFQREQDNSLGFGAIHA
jgi:exosortase